MGNRELNLQQELAQQQALVRKRTLVLQQVNALEQGLLGYMQKYEIDQLEPPFKQAIGDSQHFHAIALLYLIRIFKSCESPTAADYERLKQQIAGFLQSAESERCFYENKDLVNNKNLRAFKNLTEDKKEYSPSLSMKISNELTVLRVHHLQQRNVWQRLKSFFVDGFIKVQEKVNLKKFTEEYQNKADAAETPKDINRVEQQYTKPLQFRIELLRAIDRGQKTAGKLEQVVQEIVADMSLLEYSMRNSNQSKASSQQRNLVDDVVVQSQEKEADSNSTYSTEEIVSSDNASVDTDESDEAGYYSLDDDSDEDSDDESSGTDRSFTR